MTTAGRGATSRRRRASSAFCFRAWAPWRRRSSRGRVHAGVGSRKPIGSLTQMGTVRLGKRTDNRSPADQGLRAPRPPRRPRLRRLGRLPRQRLRGREEGRRPRGERPRADQGLPGGHQAVAGRLRPAVREEAQRAEREEGQVQARPRGPGVGRHRALPQGEGLRPPGDGLVRLDRGLPRGGRRPLLDREVREGPRREPPRHPALDDLRVLRDQGGHPVRQRRAEPLRRLPGDGRSSRRRRARRSRARTSRPARR